MKTAGIVVLVVILALIAVGVCWVVFARIRASRLGLPPPAFTSYIPFFGSTSHSSSFSGPSPAPGGIRGWFNDRVRQFRQSRNTRTAAGAYEGSYNAGYDNTQSSRGGGGGGGGGGGRFDEDAAWDSRVNHDYNPYEEERELGLQPPAVGGAAGHWGSRQQQQPAGEGYQMNLAAESAGEGERGRTRSRSPGRNPFEDPEAAAGRRNPFGDDSEMAVGGQGLKGVSPRPIDTGVGGSKGGQGQGQKEDNSPSERKSIFRENV
ncbi:acid phosphatase [Cladorrhinum sp. PSN259]|nr:acid phosphatase [Cladorrhinum sp. PSN259]